MKFFSKESAVGALFPAKSDLSLDRLDANGELPAEIQAKTKKSYAEATVDRKLKGFANCDVVRNIDGTPSAVRVISAEGVLQPLANRVNGEAINDDLYRHSTNFVHAFERDEYIIFYKEYSLINLWGGL